MAELLRFCALLESDRQTERKQAAGKVLQCIKDADIQTILDSKRDRRISWAIVIRSIINYVVIEIDILKDSTKLTTDTVQRRVKEISTTFCTAVQLADRRGSQVDASALYRHVTRILADRTLPERIRIGFINEYTSLLVRHVLKVNAHRNEMTMEIFKDLVQIYCTFLLMENIRVDRVLIMQAMTQLMDIAHQLPNFEKGDLFVFFSDILKDARNQKASGFLEASLSALNNFLKACVVDCQEQLCKLGEAVIPGILSLWSKTSLGAKDQIIELMILQLKVHNPGGQMFRDASLVHGDSKTWKICVLRLYDCLVSEFQQMVERIHRPGSKSELIQNENLISLTVDVLHQVLQYQNNSRSEIEEVTSRKRCRTETCWTLIADGIASVTNTQSCVAWCQVLACFLCKYKQSFPQEEYQNFLTTLCQAQKDNRRPGVLLWILQVLERLASVSVENKSLQRSMKPLWSRVWTSTSKLVNTLGCEEASFSLLTTILNFKLIDPETEMFQSFQTGHFRPSSESAEHLLTLLTKVALPTTWKQYSVERNVDKHSFRRQILSWFVPSVDMLATENLKDGMFKHLTSRSCTAFACLCRALLCKSPSAYASKTKQIWNVSNQRSLSRLCTGNSTDWVEQTEELMTALRSDKASPTKSTPSSVTEWNKKHYFSGRCGSVEELVDYVVEACRKIPDIFEKKELPVTKGKNFQLEWAMAATRCACFLIECLYLEQITESPATNLSLRLIPICIMQLKCLQAAITDLLGDNKLEQGLKMETLLKILSMLKDALVNTINRAFALVDSNKEEVQKLSFPSDLVHQVVKCCSRTGVVDSPNVSRHSYSHGLHSDESTMEFDDFADCGSSDNSGPSHCSSQFRPLVSRTGSFVERMESLDSLDKLRIEAFELLTCLGFSSVTDRVTTKLTRTCCQSFLSKTFDPSEHVDVQMIFAQVKAINTFRSVLGPNDFETILEALRQIVSANRNDQEICQLALSSLSDVLVLIQNSKVAINELEEGTAVIRKIVSAFWVLRKKKYSSLVRRELAKNMSLLVEMDPDGLWTDIEVMQKRKSKQTSLPHSMSMRVLFPVLLNDSSQFVRIFLASRLSILFNRGADKAGPLSPAKQLEALQHVKTAIQELSSVPGDLSDQEAEDEAHVRSVTILVALKEVILTSGFCEREALVHFLVVWKENMLNESLTREVLNQITKARGYPAAKDYLTVHSSHLIYGWMQNRKRVDEFPCFLFGMSTKDFFQLHLKDIVPQLIRARRKDALQELALMVGFRDNFVRMVEESISEIVCYILPFLVDNSGIQEKDEGKPVWAFLQTMIPCERIYALIEPAFPDVIVTLLTMVSDRTSSFLRETDPDPSPCCYSSEKFHATVAHLANAVGRGGTFISALKKEKNYFQRILLGLARVVEEAKDSREKVRLLCSYRLFVSCCAEWIKHGLGDHACFVIRDVVWRLIHWLEKAQKSKTAATEKCWKDCFPVCLEILRLICVAACEGIPSELGKYLRNIVNCLGKYALVKDREGYQALDLLQTVLLDHSRNLKQFIKDLDLFPDLPQFETLNNHLNQTVRNGNGSILTDVNEYLTRRFTDPVVVNCERLKQLRRNFAKKRSEIKALVMEDEANKVAFYNVALDLLSEAKRQLSNSDKESIEIGFEAARCVGELAIIGFNNEFLNTISTQVPFLHNGLPPPVVNEARGPLHSTYFPILHKLSQFLVDQSVHVVSVTAETLKAVLSTPAGLEFLAVYDGTESNSIIPYITPFTLQKRKKGSSAITKKSVPTVSQFSSCVNKSELWSPGCLPFTTWVVDLASTLIDTGAIRDDVLVLLAGVCALKPCFAEAVLPVLFHNALLPGDEIFSNSLSSCFNRFLEEYISQFVDNGDAFEKDKKESADKAARTLIKTINHLRKNDRPHSGRGLYTPWRNNYWLDIDYLKVAKMALGCHLYFAASLFCEIWFESQADKAKSVKGSQEIHLDDLSPVTGLEARDNCQQILLKAYEALGDPDALYGMGVGTMADIPVRIQMYQHEADYGKALVAQDLCQNLKGCANLGISMNLSRLGLNHVMMLYTQGAMSSEIMDSEFREFQFEAAWRNSVWDLDPDASSVSSYSGCVYSSLLALQDEDHEAFNSSILHAMADCFQLHFNIENESWNQLLQVLSRTSALNMLYQLGLNYFSKSCKSINDSTASLEADFGFSEHSFNLKTTGYKCLLKSNRDRNNRTLRNDVIRAVYDHLVRSTKLARQAKLFQVCEHELCEIRSLTDEHPLPSTWKIEEAKVFWDRGERGLAMHQMKTLLRQCQKDVVTDDSKDIYPEVVGVFGTWLAESRSENPTVIIEQYMEESVRLLEEAKKSDPELLMERYSSLARYACAQYENTKEYMKSPTFENKRLVIKKAKEEMQRLEEHKAPGTNPRGARYWNNLQIQCQEDEEEVRSILDDRRFFLYKAMENYIKCLQCGDKFDLHILMLCSLWLSNSADLSVNNLMKEGGLKIQSRKYLPLMYQLAARLGGTGSGQTSDFQEGLEKVIERAALDHPFHVLYIILALCNADAELNVATGRKRTRTGTSTPSPENEERIKAAKEILDRIRRQKSKLVKEMEELGAAYNELAYWDITHLKKEIGPFELPPKMLIRRLGRMESVPVATITTPIDPSCRYNDVIYIAKFESQFTHCGGVNLPKVLQIIGSDGKKRRQLVKGKDDLRQDAVMQQVFGIVNQLLRREKETRVRNLKIRTYKVVPLSKRSGLVEWCEGTMPLGDYLIGCRKTGKPGAHTRYNPKQWTTLECRKKLTDATFNEGKKSKLNVFKEILDNFSPVFRHFLMEMFPDPARWFSRRVNYTRSCAASSIVGYILGLGDRHIQNILIDCNTAELVHIDLGVAFEQGKLLPTPETVPFRLTRDLVDGMGISGVEGVFRRCCNNTLDVMRNSQEAISTVVEVLLYDPLYAWTLSPVKALEVQRKGVDLDRTDYPQTMTSVANTTVDIFEEVQTALNENDKGSKNKMAERVLMRLKQKLDGNENGSFLSVEGHVNYLIQEARDIKNLCRLFPGWQPWV